VRRSTWTRANLLAEAARATRHLRLPHTAARLELLDHVVEQALSRCVALDPPALFHAPARFRRLDGTSVFDRPSADVFHHHRSPRRRGPPPRRHHRPERPTPA
jgi:hypothetical protein